MQDGIGLLVVSGLLFLLHSILLRALGRYLWHHCERWFDKRAERDGLEPAFPGFAVEMTLGLSSFLLVLLVLKSCGLPWSLAPLLPFVPLVSRQGTKCFSFLSYPLPQLTIGHFVWLVVHLVIGITLFDAYEGKVLTPWRNAYGDYPFHFGMIASFVKAENFPPQQVFYADGFLSYPFFMNLWSAALWSWSPSYYHLALIFTFQWILLWEILYQALSTRRHHLLPWFVLLAGGGYSVLGENSGEMISSGYGWTSFLTTIWIPQRTALLGATFMGVVVTLFFQWGVAPKERRVYGGVCGIILGLMPLAHTHFFLVTALFLAMQLVVLLYENKQRKCFFRSTLLLFLPGVLIATHAIPFLSGKSSLLSFRYTGFLPSGLVEGVEGIWWVLENVWPMSLALLLLLLRMERKREVLALMLLSLIFWFVGLSVWEWDQIKLYVAIVVLLAFVMKQEYERLRFAIPSIIVLLTLPTLFEVWSVVQRGELYQMFGREELSLSSEWDRMLPKDAVLVAAPEHNTAAVLTGRRLFAGYEGWLWSHGIEYQERFQAQRALTPALQCNVGNPPCPSHLAWSERERKYWGLALPPLRDPLRMISPTLYEIRGTGEVYSLER